MVNFTTRRQYSDATCIIQPNEHPFLEHETVVRYDGSQVLSAAQVELVNRTGSRRQHQRVSQVLLERIRRGALDSPQTPDKVKTFLQNRP